MLFNSIEFAFFLPIIFILYWIIGSVRLKLQNLVLLTASYIFYGWWDKQFLLLIILSSLIDYLVAIKIDQSNHKTIKRILLNCSIVFNLGMLGVFKYFNFFIDNFIDAFSAIGIQFDKITLSVILPVGISFYTFQTLSYTIDVYNKKISSSKDAVAFFTYVAFFPQLVAGPIERAKHLLPQFLEKRKFQYDLAIDGSRQIIWGLFKKIVIADTCAIYVNEVFGDIANQSGGTLLLAAILFAFQIYGDFSGYSDIAIGTARLFGFDLMQNFAFPYFSRDIAEFWRRWHISLSTWFRDYVYIPLGGSKGGKLSQLRNVFVIFILSGFWHGANWTFILWGGFNALLFIPLLLGNRNRSNLNVVAEGRIIANLKEIINVSLTFLMTIIAWIFFRADNIWDLKLYFTQMLSHPFEQINFFIWKVWALIAMLVIIEWYHRDQKHGFVLTHLKMPTIFRRLLYISIMILIIWNFKTAQSFIYFQF